MQFNPLTFALINLNNAFLLEIVLYLFFLYKPQNIKFENQIRVHKEIIQRGNINYRGGGGKGETDK